jgi:hypothetical protein
MKADSPNMDKEDNASMLYEHPQLQTVHEYVLKNRLSLEQGNNLVDLWTTVRNYMRRYGVF